MWTVCSRCGLIFRIKEDRIICSGCNREWCCDKCATYDGYNENKDLSSCNYCRGEDYDDEELLVEALKLLKMTRKELINKIKE